MTNNKYPPRAILINCVRGSDVYEIDERLEYLRSSLISPTALQNYYRLSSTCQIYQMPQDEDVIV